MNIKQLVWAIIEGWGMIIVFAAIIFIIGLFAGWLIWG